MILHVAFLKKYNKWGDTERDLTSAWNKLTFTVHEFAQEVNLLAALIVLKDYLPLWQ